LPMRRAAVDSARIVNYTIKDEDVGVGLREANKVVSDTRPADYVTDGVDDEVEIQNAIDALTVGRDYYETVLLRGNFLISDTIKLPDYTIFRLQGKIKLKDAANVEMIENSDPTAGNSHIIIEGGVLDGNRANQTTTVQGIRLENVTDVLIKDVLITSTYHNAIRVITGERVLLKGINVQDCGAHGLYFYACTRSQMKNCVIDYAALDGFAFSGCAQSIAEGFVMRRVGRNLFSFDNASYCVFNDIVCEKTEDAILGYVGCNRITISNVIIKESVRSGVYLNIVSPKTVRDISIKNCKFFNINSGLYADTPVIHLRCADAGGVMKNIQIEGCHFDAPNATYCVQERQVAGSIDATMFCNNIVEAIGTAPTSFVGLKSFAADNITP